MEKMAKDLKNMSDMDCKFSKTSEDIPDPRELSSEKNLMIFDDLQLKKPNKREIHYNRGRHSKMYCFYLQTASDKLLYQRKCKLYLFVFSKPEKC